jgi:hypothetical protein
MAYLTNKMNENTHPFNSLVEWIAENWKYIAGFALASQLIDRFFKWLTKRSEARIKEIYNEQYDNKVKPEISRLTQSIDALKESIWELKDKIK